MLSDENVGRHIGWGILSLLLIKGFGGHTLPSFLWGKSVVLTSATVAMVGLNIQIPLSFFIDAFIMHRQGVFSFESVFGALTVVIGLIIVN